MVKKIKKIKSKEERLKEAISIRKDLANHGLSPEMPGVQKLCKTISRFVNTGDSETIIVRLPEFPNARIQLICSARRQSGINVLYDD